MNANKLGYLVFTSIIFISSTGSASAATASAYLQNFSLTVYDSDFNFEWTSLNASNTTIAGLQNGFNEQVGYPDSTPFSLVSTSSDGLNTAIGELSIDDTDGGKVSAEVVSGSALTSSYSHVIIPFAYQANSVLVFSADAALNLNAVSGEYVWGVAGISIQGFNVEDQALGGYSFVEGISYSENTTLTSVYSAPFDHTVYFLATAYVIADHSNSISAVPEPSAYALMLAGLAFIGGAYQRRNSSKTALVQRIAT